MTETIGSPVAGKGKRLEELNDEMFASRQTSGIVCEKGSCQPGRRGSDDGL